MITTSIDGFILLLLRRAITMSKLEKYVEEYVDELNIECEVEYGVRYCFYEDNIWDKFLVDLELDFDVIIKADDEYISVFNTWARDSGLFTNDAMKKRANEQRKENARDLATQAAEMGYHNYSSENGGTYYMD